MEVFAATPRDEQLQKAPPEVPERCKMEIPLQEEVPGMKHDDDWQQRNDDEPR